MSQTPSRSGSLVGSGDVLVTTVVRSGAGEGRRRRRRSHPAPTIWTRPARASSSARCSRVTAPRPSRRHRHADGVRLRLRSGEPGRRGGARACRKQRRPGRRRLLPHRFGPRRHERWHSLLGRRSGRLSDVRVARRACRDRAAGAPRRSFPVGNKQQQAISVGGSEHFALPRLAPRLRRGERLPGLVRRARRRCRRCRRQRRRLRIPGQGGCSIQRPSASSRARPAARRRRNATRAARDVVGQAFDAVGNQLSEVHVRASMATHSRAASWRSARSGPRRRAGGNRRARARGRLRPWSAARRVRPGRPYSFLIR